LLAFLCQGRSDLNYLCVYRWYLLSYALTYVEFAGLFARISFYTQTCRLEGSKDVPSGSAGVWPGKERGPAATSWGLGSDHALGMLVHHALASACMSSKMWPACRDTLTAASSG
jgi:hypothetical protein